MHVPFGSLLPDVMVGMRGVAELSPLVTEDLFVDATSEGVSHPEDLLVAVLPRSFYPVMREDETVHLVHAVDEADSHDDHGEPSLGEFRNQRENILKVLKVSGLLK